MLFFIRLQSRAEQSIVAMSKHPVTTCAVTPEVNEHSRYIPIFTEMQVDLQMASLIELFINAAGQ